MWTKQWQAGAAVLRDYLMMTVGALLAAVAVNVFFVPNDLVTGGLLGGAILLQNFFGTPIGLVTLVVNIPLFILGYRSLGGLVFGVRTLYATTVLSLAIDLTAPYLAPLAHHFTGEPLLYILYGAVLDGLGIGLVFRARGTTGGIDILARWIEQRFGTQPGRSMLVMNVVVFGLAFVAYSPEAVLYALLAAFIGSFTLDYALAAGTGARQALIITSRPSQVTVSLLHDLGRGVTMLEGYGGYTGAERSVLLCVVSRAEISFLKNIVRDIDPRAFVVIGEVSEVLGEGFRPFAVASRPTATPPPPEPEEQIVGERRRS